MERILLIDDDVELCEILRDYFTVEEFRIDSAHDGVLGLERARSGEYALVILDLLLPAMRGLDVLRRLRTGSTIPVLILTARGEDVDRIVGLELGADDYLPKPFNSRELLARVRAILRRARSNGETSAPIHVGDVTVDPSVRTALLDNEPIDLTMAEFGLLEALVRAAGQVVSRDHLAEHVLGRKLASYDRSIDVHISNLRKKLNDRGGNRQRIRAVRGEGYVFVRVESEPH